MFNYTIVTEGIQAELRKNKVVFVCLQMTSSKQKDRLSTIPSRSSYKVITLNGYTASGC